MSFPSFCEYEDEIDTLGTHPLLKKCLQETSTTAGPLTFETLDLTGAIDGLRGMQNSDDVQVRSL